MESQLKRSEVIGIEVGELSRNQRDWQKKILALEAMVRSPCRPMKSATTLFHDGRAKPVFLEPSEVTYAESDERSETMIPAAILVVNDDEDALFLFERSILRAFPKAKVLKSHDGAHALEMLKEHQVDAVVTDQRMPDMDGVTLVKAIRALNHEFPVMLVTTLDNVKAAAYAAGATYFLSLSDWRQVGEKLAHLLEKNPGRLSV